jgi:EAL domain
LALTEFVMTKALTDWRLLSATTLSKLAIPALIRDHAPKTPRCPASSSKLRKTRLFRIFPLRRKWAAQMGLYNVSSAIHDFGAGYSSIARLRTLQFCELKLDGSFVKNCASDRTNEGITQTIGS